MIEPVAQIGVDLIDDRLIVGQDLLATGLGVWIQLILTLADQLHARTDAAFGETLGLQDSVHLGADAFDLGQADLVNLVGAHVGGGLVADAPGVVGLAVGQAPGAVIAGGPRQQRLVMGNQTPIGRIHHFVDGARHLRAQCLADGFRQLLRGNLRQFFLEAGVQHVFARRGFDESAHLLEHLLHGEPRRQDAQRFSMSQAFQHLVELGTEQAQPADVVTGVAFALDEMAVDHEIRHAALRPEHLIDRKVVVAEALAILDQITEESIEDVVGNQRLTAVVSALIAFEGGVVLLQLDQLSLIMRQRIIPKLGVVALDAHRLQQAHLREHFRIVERELQEHPTIEPVDAERLAIPGVRCQCAAQQHHDQHQQGDPLEQALDHGRQFSESQPSSLPADAVVRDRQWSWWAHQRVS